MHGTEAVRQALALSVTGLGQLQAGTDDARGETASYDVSDTSPLAVFVFKSREDNFGKTSYGIHGTLEPETIGKQASMGCVRLKMEDIQIAELNSLNAALAVIRAVGVETGFPELAETFEDPTCLTAREVRDTQLARAVALVQGGGVDPIDQRERFEAQAPATE